MLALKRPIQIWIRSWYRLSLFSAWLLRAAEVIVIFTVWFRTLDCAFSISFKRKFFWRPGPLTKKICLNWSLKVQRNFFVWFFAFDHQRARYREVFFLRPRGISKEISKIQIQIINFKISINDGNISWILLNLRTIIKHKLYKFARIFNSPWR